MESLSLSGKAVLISGAARRVGRILALACARVGAEVVIHYRNSQEETRTTQEEILSLSRRAWLLSADFNDAAEIFNLMEQARKISPLYALINSAAFFEALSFDTTSLDDWHQQIIKGIPSERWIQPKELEEALIFLHSGTAYITGEIIHVDGGSPGCRGRLSRARWRRR